MTSRANKVAKADHDSEGWVTVGVHRCDMGSSKCKRGVSSTVVVRNLAEHVRSRCCVGESRVENVTESIE